MQQVLIINGPNLNLLGTREPDTYGNTTLAEIETAAIKKGKGLGLSVKTFQSNSEGELINHIHAAQKTSDLIIINAAALTHTSIGIRDALLATGLPMIEVHLSNVYKRESFRHHSYLSDIAIGVIAGFGALGYELALEAASQYLKANGKKGKA